MGPVDLHHLEARGPGPQGGLTEVFHDLVDFLRGQAAGGGEILVVGSIGDSHGLPAAFVPGHGSVDMAQAETAGGAFPPSVVELDGGYRAGLADPFGDPGPGPDLVVVPQA